MDAIAKLREENELLREQVRQLEDLLAPQTIFPPEGCRLTATELKIYRHMKSGRIVSTETLITILSMRATWDILGVDNVRVHIYRMRRKLAAFGETIRNDFGHGYQLVPLHAEAA